VPVSRADYNGPMAEAYDRGRTLHPEAADVWRSAIASFVDRIEGPVLDLGSGTGRFSGLIAEWFNVSVIGVEPAWGMLAEALKKERDPRVSYVRGAAEHVPLADDSCRLAWLSNSAHHFEDMLAAARELRRVLIDGAAVFIRTGFVDRYRPGEVPLFEYFPEAGKVFETFPTFTETVETFGTAGWQLERVGRFPQPIAGSLGEFLDRVRTRADSTLEAISDEAFLAGLARIEADVAHEKEPARVWDPLDLVLLR
jgi:ubiquinone/menaquinone biosynthesis C-methylase UbiE